MDSGGLGYFVAGVVSAALVVVAGYALSSSDRSVWLRQLWAFTRQRTQDVALFLFALACLTTGVLALFRDHDGPTATALVIAGMGLMALLYLGPRLERLKIGSLEVVLRELAKSATDAQTRGDQETAESLRDSIPRLLSIYGAAGPNSTESDLMAEVETILNILAPQGVRVHREYLFRFEGQDPAQWRADYLLERGETRLVVEVATRHLGAFNRRLLRASIARVAAQPSAPQIVILVADSTYNKFNAELGDLRGVTLVRWAPEKDAMALRAAMVRAFGSN